MNIERECIEEQGVNRKILGKNHELQLWQHFKRGDKNAFGQIFKIYYNTLMAYGQKIYPDYDFINDCAQEMFIMLWEYRKTISDVYSVEFYILKCFNRKVRRNLQLLKKETKALKNTKGEIVIHSFETELVFKQTEEHKRRQVENEIKGLTKRQQEAIFLKFYEGLGYDEICSLMSLNYQSVKNIIHQSVKTLRARVVL